MLLQLVNGSEDRGLRSLPCLDFDPTIRLQQYVAYATYDIAMKISQFTLEFRFNAQC